MHRFPNGLLAFASAVGLAWGSPLTILAQDSHGATPDPAATLERMLTFAETGPCSIEGLTPATSPEGSGSEHDSWVWVGDGVRAEGSSTFRALGQGSIVLTLHAEFDIGSLEPAPGCLTAVMPSDVSAGDRIPLRVPGAEDGIRYVDGGAAVLRVAVNAGEFAMASGAGTLRVHTVEPGKLEGSLDFVGPYKDRAPDAPQGGVHAHDEATPPVIAAFSAKHVEASLDGGERAVAGSARFADGIPSALEAWTRFLDCNERLRNGEGEPAIRDCLTADRAEGILQGGHEDLVTWRPVALALVSVRPSQPESVAFWATGEMDDAPAGIRVRLVQEGKQWKLVEEEVRVVSEVLSGVGRSNAYLEVRIDERRSLSSDMVVWTRSDALGHPTHIVEPLFEGPTIRIDNLGPETQSQNIVGIASAGTSDPSQVRAHVEGGDLPRGAEVSGELRVDRNHDGRMSGILRVWLQTVTETRQVEVWFHDLPTR